MSILYRTEANMRFERRSFDPRQIDGVLRGFGLPAADVASEVVKDNRLSMVIIARCGRDDIVLRRCPGALSTQIELQSLVFATLRGACVVRPLKSKTGHYVQSDEASAWIAYEYVPGQLYCDARHEPFAAIESALQCVAALAAWDIAHPVEAGALRLTDRLSSQWGDLPSRLLDFRWRSALGNDTAALVADASHAIRDLQGTCREATSNRHGVTHADLQPANIVAGPGGVTVIDIEDVCRDDVGLSASHAIFKLTRHAVFLGLMSVERARAELCMRGIELARSLGIDVNNAGFARQLAARRTIDDISIILNLAESPNTRWMLYDLRKKVHNLFELAELFGESLTIKHVV